jgi:hypothetical protein
MEHLWVNALVVQMDIDGVGWRDVGKQVVE